VTTDPSSPHGGRPFGPPEDPGFGLPTLGPTDSAGAIPDGSPLSQSAAGSPSRPVADGAGLRVGPDDDPDRYDLVGEGMSGGEGTTWQARYPGRIAQPLPVAVKMLRPPPEAGPDWPTAGEQQRLRDQAAVLRHVHHAHLVQVHDVFAGPPPHPAGVGGGGAPAAHVLYVVMEWMDGPTLQNAVRATAATAGNLTSRLGYVADLAHAVAALASRTQSGNNPSLHRDIKPANAIVNDRRGLVLVDVSTLRLVNEADPAGLHSPGYTAPEVLASPNAPRTPASDAYSLAAVAAYCVTGRVPPRLLDEEGLADLRSVLEQIATNAGARRPAEMAASIVSGLAADPAQRPADLVAWAVQLLDDAAAKPEAAAPALTIRRRGLAVAVAGAAVVLGVGTTLAFARPWDSGGTGAATQSPQPAAIIAGSGARLASVGRIDSSADGSAVSQCAYLSGTATVAPGEMLGLAMLNLVNKERHHYLQPVFAKPDPRTGTWRGAQYFGKGNDSVGQNYRVELIAVKASVKLDGTMTYDEESAAYGRVKVLDTIEVHRVAGEGPTPGCPGP